LYYYVYLTAGAPRTCLSLSRPRGPASAAALQQQRSARSLKPGIMTPPPVLATVSLLLLSQLLLAGSDTPACHTALVDSCSTDAAKAHSPFASEPCAVCAGKLQHKLRAAGCTHADIQAYCKNGENPFGPFPPTKRGGLDFNCTLASPLDVLFASPVGAVHCGTPVTGCPTAVVQTEPRVTLSTAEAASGYVVMMLDGQSSNRHWMLGNVPGTLLSAGFANENISGHPAAPHLSILSPYWGPHSTTNVYAQFIFKQPQAVLSFPPYVAGGSNKDRCPVGNANCAERHDWDYNSFIERYQLGEKVASNFFHCHG
jgi:hypothetical protein